MQGVFNAIGPAMILINAVCCSSNAQPVIFNQWRDDVTSLAAVMMTAASRSDDTINLDETNAVTVIQAKTWRSDGHQWRNDNDDVNGAKTAWRNGEANDPCNIQSDVVNVPWHAMT